jgi:hypothetical protein
MVILMVLNACSACRGMLVYWRETQIKERMVVSDPRRAACQFHMYFGACALTRATTLALLYFLGHNLKSPQPVSPEDQTQSVAGASEILADVPGFMYSLLYVRVFIEWSRVVPSWRRYLAGMTVANQLLVLFSFLSMVVLAAVKMLPPASAREPPGDDGGMDAAMPVQHGIILTAHTATAAAFGYTSLSLLSLLCLRRTHALERRSDGTPTALQRPSNGTLTPLQRLLSRHALPPCAPSSPARTKPFAGTSPREGWACRRTASGPSSTSAGAGCWRTRSPCRWPRWRARCPPNGSL